MVQPSEQLLYPICLPSQCGSTSKIITTTTSNGSSHLLWDRKMPIFSDIYFCQQSWFGERQFPFLKPPALFPAVSLPSSHPRTFPALLFTTLLLFLLSLLLLSNTCAAVCTQACGGTRRSQTVWHLWQLDITYFTETNPKSCFIKVNNATLPYQENIIR